MSELCIAKIRLHHFGGVDTFKTEPNLVEPGDWCIIQMDNNLDYGKVLEIEQIKEGDIPETFNVIRKCTKEDLQVISQNLKDVQVQIPLCQEEITKLELNMKLIIAEYSFDKSKIIFHFSAEDRVDFRQLVRELARKFHIRIELHQIGIRDETKIIGGIGCCGRRVCCSSWIHNFSAVNIRMAKLQIIQLHPAKLTGVCGRLKCCLNYEYKQYRELEQNLPKKGQRIRTEAGTGDVLDTNILLQTVIVRMDDESIVTLPASQLTVISRSKGKAKLRTQKRKNRQNFDDKNQVIEEGDDEFEDDLDDDNFDDEIDETLKNLE